MILTSIEHEHHKSKMNVDEDDDEVGEKTTNVVTKVNSNEIVGKVCFCAFCRFF